MTSLTKMELDIEDHILGQTKKLSDGAYEKIYSRNERNDFGIFTYNCHLCSVANLPGEIALRTHINGRKHQNRLVYSYVPDAKQFRAPLSIHPKIQPVPSASFAFGEPRPPGLEDENSSCYLDQFLTKCSKPMIGVEYVLELLDPKMKEPLYICTLCDKRCDPRNILPQMTSHRHRMKYLDTHFPKVMNILNRDREFNINMAHREDVLTFIAQLLEDKFGRCKPMVCDYRDYERNKSQVLERIKNLKHFGEKDLPGSEEVLLKNFKVDRIQLEEILSDEDSEGDKNYEKYCEKKKKRENPHIIERAPQRFADSRQTALAFAHVSAPSTSNPVQKFVTPRELQAQSEMKFKDAYTFEKYKTLVELECKRIELKYKDFEKSPEKHPHYSDEWKNFWQRRYNELLAQGKDANGHNYKPEWVDFWMPRMRQLKLKEVDDKKKEIRKKLSITLETARKYEQDIAKKVASPKRVHSKSISRSPSPDRTRNRRKSRSPVVISDDSEDEHRRRRRDDNKRPRRDRSNSRSRNRYSESPINYRSRSRERNRRSESNELTDDAPVNIVTVCRLLTALESELGIIAPRVMQILENALAMERNEANSSEKMLLEISNVNFLDTVKEKLKGLLSADLVGQSRMIPVKRAIKNIAALLHEAQKLKARQPAKPAGASSSSAASSQPDSVELAKLEIAKVLAQTLIDQGRTDVSPEELSEIVDEFMRSQMAEDEEKKKKEVKIEPKPSSSQPPKEEKRDDESGLENLTNDDLKTLLRNFSDLTEEEQKHLIKYLEKLEKTDPRRVKMLSRYVDAGDDEIDDDEYERENDVDMDYASNVKDSPKNAPNQANKLSDDEYGDDQEVSRSDSFPTYSQPLATLSNNQNVAAELFSSLMQSQQPQAQVPMNSWNWDMNSGTYYQPPQPQSSFSQSQSSFSQAQPSFSNMQPPPFDYSQQMAAMSMMQPQASSHFQPGPWRNTNAQFEQMSFANRQPPPPRPGTSSGQQQSASDRRKKDQRSTNNLQLTGKGKNKNGQNQP